MPLDSFAASRSLTLGVELELQIVSTHDYDLMPSAADLLRVLGTPALPGDVKPEITASMIELSTGICADYEEALRQLRDIRDALVAAADRINVGLCGGGTHPYQHWGERRIFEAPRYQQLSELYGYLAKQFTVFGQHVHVGCSGPDEALNLLHCLSRYVPHFIALSASSPYVQGYDTGFQSARLNSIFAFPLSGRAPFVETWADFNAYFDKITATGVVKSMKDFYWDIRPKPEFGTVEVRVMDTPLTVTHAARLAAYIQALARWLLVERPFRPAEDDYLVYTFNRFQACRFGYAGAYVDPGDHRQHTLGEHILETLEHVRQHAAELGADAPLAELADEVRVGVNDAVRLRDLLAREHSLPEVVRQQCQRWRGN